MSQQKKSRYLDILLIAGVLVVLSMLSVFVDIEITKHRRSEFVAGDFRRIIQLSEIFAHGFGITIVLYLCWVFNPGKRKLLPRLAACAILPGLLAQLIKMFVARKRPGFFYPEFADKVADTWVGFVPNGQMNVEYVTQSFPSAHTATAVGLAAGLIWLLPAGRHLFITLAFLSAVQRIVAGAHWTSDVFAGAAVSILVIGFVFRNRRVNAMFERIEKDATPDLVAENSELQNEWKDTDEEQISKAA